jgi:predicted dehydrogenase
MIRAGIVGMGYMGWTHYRALRQVPDVEVVGIFHTSAEELRRELPEVPVYGSRQELYRGAKPEAVIVAVPTFLHEECVAEAAQAGCHVLCEKPFALDVASAERMLDKAERHQATLMVGQVLRFWPQYRRIKELADNGALGSLWSITAYRLASLPAWSSWFRDPAKSGGCLLDLQIHDVDFVHWIFGNPEMVCTQGIRSEAESWDHVWTSLNYGDRVAQLEASYLMPPSWPFSTGIRLEGSKGCLEYSFGVQGNIEEREKAAHQFIHYEGERSTMIEVPSADPFVEELRYFFDCIKAGHKPLLCAPEESVQVMRVIEASRQSVESGRPVRFSPDPLRRSV